MKMDQNLPALVERLAIDVRRKFVLQDALKEGHKQKFSSQKVLKVRAGLCRLCSVWYVRVVDM